MISRYLLKILIMVFIIFICLSNSLIYGQVKGNNIDHALRIKKNSSINEKNDDTPKRSILMKEIEIHGEVEKPKAMFIIPRTSSDYKFNEKKKDFTDEILRPMDMESIEDMVKFLESIR